MRGAWIEIPAAVRPLVASSGRSPCGERGLKCYFSVCVRQKSKSLPVRGAWIEIAARRGVACLILSSLPVRGAWIEIVCVRQKSKYKKSLPVRGAWIEICPWPSAACTPRCRSPCGERGLKSPSSGGWCGRWWRRSPCGERGLKYYVGGAVVLVARSLPVRGAWIEMLLMQCGEMPVLVAPRAGSVD